MSAYTRAATGLAGKKIRVPREASARDTNEYAAQAWNVRVHAGMSQRAWTSTQVGARVCSTFGRRVRGKRCHASSIH
jgi:hypothetical protein